MNSLKNSKSLAYVKTIVFLITTSFLLSSCEKDKDNNSEPLPDNLNGVFIVNEGAFGAGNGSISFLSADSNYFVKDLYTNVNGLPLGDVVQSMTIFGSKAYIVVNNSQKVEVVNIKDFTSQGPIEGLSSPRSFVGSSAKGYISDWTSNKVHIVDLNSLAIIKSVDCGQGPEEMAIAQGKLFVCNSGGFTDDSTITVIDLATETVVNTIPTNWNPSSIKSDIDGNLWVLCKGSLGSDFTPTPDDAPGALLRINPVTYAIEKSFVFNYNQHPAKMQMNAAKNNLYFLMGTYGYSGVVFSYAINEPVMPVVPFINQEFYGLGVNPTDGKIFGGRTNFSSDTYMLRYTQTGNLIDSIQVGIGPNGFAFN
jgi:YVTN family beta-propeller protein